MRAYARLAFLIAQRTENKGNVKMNDLVPVFDMGSVAGLSARSGVGRLRRGGVAERVLRDYFSYQTKASEYTVRSILKNIANDLGVLGQSGRIEDVEWWHIKAEDFSELMFHWRGRLSVVTMRRYLSALRGLSRQCFLNNLMDGDSYARIREVKLPKGVNRAGKGICVDREDQGELLYSCMVDERIARGLRDAAMIGLTFGSGIRRAEAASLKDGDIDLETGRMRVVVKGGDTVTRYVSAWALPYIKEWIEYKTLHEVAGSFILTRVYKNGRVGRDGLTGSGLFYLFEQRSKDAMIGFLVRPHDARRTMGTEMIKEHGELVAQRVLGHASLDTTRIYDMRDDDLIKNIMAGRK